MLLESSEGGEVELDVSYQVWGAKWYPSYDIRVDNKSDQGNNMKVWERNKGRLLRMLMVDAYQYLKRES